MGHEFFYYYFLFVFLDILWQKILQKVKSLYPFDKFWSYSSSRDSIHEVLNKFFQQFHNYNFGLCFQFFFWCLREWILISKIKSSQSYTRCLVRILCFTMVPVPLKKNFLVSTKL